MKECFDLYTAVRVKDQGITGVIISVDTDGGTKPPVYLIEKDDKHKTGKNDLVWVEPHEIELI